MGASQPHPEQRDPNGLGMVRVATYEREIGASMERVWENVLDWEHLPHLHDSSFSCIELDEAGAWGWRVWSDPGHRDHIELCLADAHSYVSRSYTDGRQNAEIWTTLTPAGEHTAIEVEFLVPGVAPERIHAVGAALTALYTRLWDEDEAMMIERQRRLDEARDRVREISLGPREGLELPLRFQLAGREYELDDVDGALEIAPTVCPHLLGPLSRDGASGELVCPWHGYRFDAASGACLAPAHATCRLPPTPELRDDGEGLIAVLR